MTRKEVVQEVISLIRTLGAGIITKIERFSRQPQQNIYWFAELNFKRAENMNIPTHLFYILCSPYISHIYLLRTSFKYFCIILFFPTFCQ